MLLTILGIVAFGLANPSGKFSQISSALTITASTDQPSYRQRQKVALSGSIMLGGSPATNLVVVEEVTNPSPFGPRLFRTLQIGTPNQLWLVQVTSIYIQDMNSTAIDTVKAGSQMQVGMNVFNTQSSAISIYAATTVFDANMVALTTNYWASSMDPLQTVGSKFTLQVPSWACSGRAIIIGCVYSDEPTNGGIAYSPEQALYYSISRTQTGLLGITQPPPPTQNTTGVYNDPIRLPPDPRPGQYSIFVLGQSSPSTLSSATTGFSVQSTNGIPPQASFAYSPPNPVVTRAVSFDASSSSPEGYNDIITRYEWDFGDGTPKYVTTGNPADPTASHTYTQATQYVVTLNVTNSEALWCTTSKPITVGYGYGPTANFTWTPQHAVINVTITFDASNSQPGDYGTLTNYLWNFSDATGIFNLTANHATHSYIQPGNYNVTLTVLDSVGRNASTSGTVNVQNYTIKIYDIYPTGGDGKIDGGDIAIVAYAFGSYPGSPDGRWNPVCDVNGDLKIDGQDIALVAMVFGQDP